MLSAFTRGCLFFATTLWTGVFEHAVQAMAAEFSFRGITSGFYAAAVQSVRNLRPAWLGLGVVLIVLPASAHVLEYLFHRSLGTPLLAVSIAGSLLFTALSSSFHLFAMRRGAFITGKGARSILQDLRSAPALLVDFVLAPARRRRRLRTSLPPVIRVRSSVPKTLHITNAYHATSGGIGVFYRALIEAGNRASRHVRLVVPGERTTVEDVGAWARIYTIRAPRSPVFDRRYRLLLPHLYAWPYESPLRRILREEQPDIVEVCDKYALSCLPSVLRRNWIAGLPKPTLIGMSCERMDDNVRAYLGGHRAARRFAQWYMRHVYVPRFDCHLANSFYTADEIFDAASERYQHRIFICPMGVDAEVFGAARPSAEMRAHYLRLVRGGPQCVLLVYSGRLSPEKNLLLLVEALAALPDTDSRQYRLLIAGAGPFEPALLQEVRRRTPGRAFFLGHISRPADLADVYANADVFIHPNPREPFGIGPLEAMAAGLPVVAPASGGVLSYLHGGNAWLAAPEAPAFAAAVRDLMSAPDLRRRRIEEGLRTVQEHHWENITARLFALYDEIHSRSSREVL